MSDDKDLEIARLQGQVEALKEQLDKERALRPTQYAVSGPWPEPVCFHFNRVRTSGGEHCFNCGKNLPIIVGTQTSTNPEYWQPLHHCRPFPRGAS